MSFYRKLKKGDKGKDVREWQQMLESAGYDLFPFGDDGDFGEATHNATLSWQKDRGIPITGIFDPSDLNKSPIIKNANTDILNIKFIQAKNYTVANREEVKWIVMHSMEAGESSTTAENVAKWFAGTNAPKASAHFCADDDSIVQCVKEEDIAWHAPGANKYGIGIEMAGYSRQTREQWLDTFSKRMLQRSAILTAHLCKRWDIPIKYIDRNDLKLGRRGITTHNEVTFAFRKSDHVDPGKEFPMDLFLQWVQEAYDKLK